MKIKIYVASAVMALAGVFFGCSPDSVGSGNGIVSPELDASFTITPVDGSPNRFLLQANDNSNTLTHYWSNGTSNSRGTSTREIFLPDAGTYTITHTSIGIGGTPFTSQQTLEVLTPDPISGNQILGGQFETAEDISHWVTFPETVNGAVWTFADGKATFTGSQNWAIQNLYQTIEVEGGHDYSFDMTVSGQGSQETYFEWYAGYNPPVAGTDYTEGGQILALNTWAGCATSPFAGQLSEVGCADTLGGVRHFDTSGTVYVLVRTASGQSSSNPFSITIDNVEVRRLN